MQKSITIVYCCSFFIRVHLDGNVEDQYGFTSILSIISIGTSYYMKYK